MPKDKPKKDRTDLTGRHDVSMQEIIKGLTPRKERESGKTRESKWDRAAKQ